MSQNQPQRRKILIVDDEQAIRESLDAYLSSKGHQITTQPDSSFCLSTDPDTASCCNEHPCADFMLVDLRMPVTSGIKLLTLQQEKGCKLPADKKAVLSAYISEDVRDTLDAMGICYFEKPLRYANLQHWLEGCGEDEER